jgi:hypothetical protein
MSDDRERLLLPCDCHGHHFLDVYFPYEEGEPDYNRYVYFTVSVRPETLRQRIKYAVNSLRGKVAYEAMEVLVDLTGRDKLRAFLVEGKPE